MDDFWLGHWLIGCWGAVRRPADGLLSWPWVASDDSADVEWWYIRCLIMKVNIKSPITNYLPMRVSLVTPTWQVTFTHETHPTVTLVSR